MSEDERDHRVRRARERAGLSVGQAARMLGVTPEDIRRIEDPSRALVERAPELAELYGVSVDWLTGAAPRCDYARLATINGADKLCEHDREILAEFIASLPTRQPKTLADIAALRADTKDDKDGAP